MDNKLKQLISKVRKEHDDDSVDRCIYASTVYIIGFFAVGITHGKLIFLKINFLFVRFSI